MRPQLATATILAVAILACPDRATAGAWLRAKGESFVASSATLRRPANGGPATQSSGLLLEYGLRPRLTLGLDLHHDLIDTGHVLGFARLPLTGADRRLKLALDLGVGAHQQTGMWHAMGKVALSLGHGFRLRARPGWLSVDAAVEARTGLDAPLYKLDATLGLAVTEKVTALLSVESFALADSTGWAVIPTLAYTNAKARTFTAGIELKDDGTRSLGVKLGFWHSF